MLVVPSPVIGRFCAEDALIKMNCSNIREIRASCAKKFLARWKNRERKIITLKILCGERVFNFLSLRINQVNDQTAIP